VGRADKLATTLGSHKLLKLVQRQFFWNTKVHYPIHNSTPLTPILVKRIGKAVPLQAWTGPEGSRNFRLPDFKKIGT